MTRNQLLPLLVLGLLTACSSGGLGGIGPHRIDVQQGNALDQENVAKLKPGLNRSQVRFLLGTPLVVDPFRTDRWDYVYTFYKSGKLAEQKRITLFFDGETLKRIEGDVPSEVIAAQADAAGVTATQAVQTSELSGTATTAAQNNAVESVTQSTPVAMIEPVVSVTTVSEPMDAKNKTSSAVKTPSSNGVTSIVPPMPSPPGAPAYKDARTAIKPAKKAAADSAQSGMQVESNINRIQPDVTPVFPDKGAATATQRTDADEAAVLHALKSWADAWSRRDDDAYIAAYDSGFLPQDGGTHADWEKRRRLLLGLAKNIELKIDSPTVEFSPDGSALVTLNQYYRSDNFKDAVVKQITLVQKAGHWLITEERVASVRHMGKP